VAGVVAEVLDLASCEFRAMGTDVHVLVVDGDDADLHWARAEVDRLEGLWSRFVAHSDVSRINHNPDTWVDVAPETLHLLGAAVDAWSDTAGAFDPLLGAQMEALGYDRSFERVDQAGAGATCPPPPPPRRHHDDLRLDEGRGRARIEPGRALDLGGIAKGWTADGLVAALLARGAGGACANLGGDIAVGGRAPAEDGWYVAVDHRVASELHRVIAVPSGGAATSTTLRRRWAGPGGDDRHHLLDPSRSTSCHGTLVEVTTLAASAARAEVLTKVAFVAPSRLDGVIDLGEAALLTTSDGATRVIGDVDRFRPVTTRAVSIAG